ncbi:MAG TPA: O-antigen ligase family protein [Egicoccus sp.]|nr:O-antigen ligase family protein [Egicoccus sp.]HSK21710.1 O-antigen ligase family protein [Egicoccus sp.]
MTAEALAGRWSGAAEIRQRRALLVAPLRKVTFWVLFVFVLTIPSSSVVVVSEDVGTVSRLVGLAALPPAALAVALGGRRARLLDVHVLLLVLVGWIAASTMWTRDLSATTGTVFTALQLLVLVLLVWEFAGDTDRWRALLVAYVLGCWVAAAQLLAAPVLGRAGLDSARYSVGDFNPNDLAQILLVGLPVATYLGIHHPRRAVRLLAWVYLPLGSVANLLTGSRQALVVLPLALLLVPIGVRRLSPAARVTTGVVAVASLLVVVVLVPAPTMTRLLSVGTEFGDGGLGGRALLWSSALDAVADEPVTGVGAGSLGRLIQRDVGYTAGAHNSLLSVAAELGMVGLALFLAVLAATAVRVLRFRAQERAFGVVTFLVVLATLLPGHNEYDKSTWLALAMLVGPAAGLGAAHAFRDRVRAEVVT